MTISAGQIARVRAFNRDYTRRIGVLSEGLLASPYSLTEVRVMYEIAHRRNVTAGELANELDLDPGYLSRLLKGFETKKLLAREASAEDGRRQHLRLTPAGKRVFAPLERRSRAQVRAMLSALDEKRRGAVLEAMHVIHSAFDGSHAPITTARLNEPASHGGQSEATGVRLSQSSSHGGQPNATGSSGLAGKVGPDKTLSADISFRPHRPGDMGWVVQRHGELYWQEYGWNEEFEVLVADVTVDFIRKLDATRERCWIAEREGRRLGCIFVVAKDATTAKLRLLLVEPEARGLGVGRALVAECVRFARAAGYQKIVLWTQENLVAARRLYSEAGFERTAQQPHQLFGGHDLVSETWELELRAAAA
jgi:DNA-binding MarR family transcriptional regulator/GNAT superfamily N-acetyltransferase